MMILYIRILCLILIICTATTSGGPTGYQGSTVVENIQIYFVISLWLHSIKRQNGGRETEVACSRYNRAAVKVKKKSYLICDVVPN